MNDVLAYLEARKAQIQDDVADLRSQFLVTERKFDADEIQKLIDEQEIVLEWIEEEIEMLTV